MVLGDAPDLGRHHITPEHALNPEKYFIVVINQIGNGLSSSPHNTEDPHPMARFPHDRIGDDVRAQEQLLREQLGIEELELVVDGSMGAQQTYEWVVRLSEKVKRASPIAGAPTVTSAQLWAASPPRRSSCP